MAKALRNLNRAKPQSCGVGLLAVLILVSLSYVTMSRTNKMRISIGKFLCVSCLLHVVPLARSGSHDS